MSRNLRDCVCRVCRATETTSLGEVEFNEGLVSSITDCSACGCRFAPHDNSVYEILHSLPDSSYVRYRELAEQCCSMFKEQDIAGLSRLLCQVPKYRFAIEKLKPLPKGAKILEVGCATGFLTSLFLLSGHDITGVDISGDAVESAKRDFGGKFFKPDDPQIVAQSPYDAILHLGTIGCVEDPIGMIEELMRLLRPGGLMIFNAPNADACLLRDQVWFSTAYPPDLVTLFKPGFFKNHFQHLAQVDEVFEPCDAVLNTKLNISRFFGKKWIPPLPVAIEGSRNVRFRSESRIERYTSLLMRMLAHVLDFSGAARFLPSLPSEYGFFVSMRKTSDANSQAEGI